MKFDPDCSIIKKRCEQLIGKDFVMSVSFDSEVLPLEECEGLNNAVGCILEQMVFLMLRKELSFLERGAKQKSPDYYNRNIYEYELKCFEKKPSFDISAYNSYVKQLEHPNGLQRKLFDTKYLVFKYCLTGSKIIIENFWMLNIWNLVNSTSKYPISVQMKHHIWFNIRPSTENKWYDKKRHPKFFIENIIKSIKLCPNMTGKDEVLQRLHEQIIQIPDNFYDTFYTFKN